MKTDAILFAETTRAVLIGISSYGNPTLLLRRPAADVWALAKALKTTDGCAIPSININTLVDQQATRDNIINTLSDVGAACLPHEILLVFFAGHGNMIDNTFYLLPVNADPAQLAQTAVAAEDLEGALAGTRARGVLVVLDCCTGAGYAESAGPFFRTLGEGIDFRVLISASRAQQSSFEDEDGTIFTKHLTSAIIGTDDLGSGGAIYLTELIEHLQDSVAEDLERVGRSGQQEPTFAGTYTRDPLLFVHRGLSLQNVRFSIKKYSRQQIRFIFLRTVVIAALITVFTIGSVYTWLDHRQYITTSGANLALFRGDPRLSLPGIFPKHVWTFDLPVSATSLSQGIRFDKGQCLTASSSDPILDRLASMLDPEWRAAFALSRGNRQEFIQAFTNAAPWRSSAAHDGAMSALAGLNSLSSLSDEEFASVSRLVNSDNTSDVEAAALGVMAHFRPDDAIEELEEAIEVGGSDLHKYYDLFFLGLNRRTPAVDNFLTAIATIENKDYITARIFPEWEYALVRLNIRLDEDVVRKAVKNHQNQDTGLIIYATRWDYPTLGHFLSEDLASERAGNDVIAGSVEIRDLIALASIGKDTVIDDLFAIVQTEEDNTSAPEIRVAAINALLARTRSASSAILKRAPFDPWSAATLVRAGMGAEALTAIDQSIKVWKSKVSPSNSDELGLEYLLAEIRKRNLHEALPSVLQLTSDTHPAVRIEAEWCSEALTNGPRSSDSAIGIRSNYLTAVPPGNRDIIAPFPSLRTAESAWLCKHSDCAFSNLLQLITDSVANGPPTFEVQRIMAQVQLSTEGINRIRELLGTPSRRSMATAILAMFDTPQNVRALLSSPDVAIRQAAADYACFNSRASDLRLMLPVAVGGPSSASTTVLQDIAILDDIRKEIDRTPDDYKSMLLRLITEARSDCEIRPGIILWLDRQARRWAEIGAAEWPSLDTGF